MTGRPKAQTANRGDTVPGEEKREKVVTETGSESECTAD